MDTSEGMIDTGDIRPLFSVIVPIYNGERFIVDCLESILIQESGTYEVLLIDDGSTDDTSSICDEYSKRYPQTIRVFHTANRGQLAARLLGIAESHGKYMCFIDSDDKIEKGMFSDIARIISLHDVDMILIPFLRINEDGKKSGDHKSYFSEGPVTKEELLKKWACTPELNSLWAKIGRRELYSSEPNRSFGSMAIGEDMAQSLPSVLMANTFYYVDTPYYLYRDNPDSVMHVYRRDEYKHLEFEGTMLLEALRSLGYDDDVTVMGIYQRCLQSTWKRVSRASVNDLTYKDKHLVFEEIRSYKIVQEAASYISSVGLKSHVLLALKLFFYRFDFLLVFYCNAINSLKSLKA